MNPLRRMGYQAGRHRNAVERSAVEERDLVEVDIAVIPGCALGAGHAFGGLGQEVHHVYAGRLHEQVHRRRQVHAVRRHHVVVLDVEGEGEVIAAPALHVERIVLVKERSRPNPIYWGVDQPDLVFVPAVIVDGGGLGDDGLRRIEGEVASQITRCRHPELVGGLDHQQRGCPIVAVGNLAEGARLGDVDPVALAVAQWPELRLQQARALVHKAEEVSVDVADEERHRLGAPRQQDEAVGIAEHQQRTARGIAGIAGFEL